MTYEEIDPKTWIPTNAGDFIEGVYLHIKLDVGANHANIYSIETPTGVLSVWGCTVLDEKMALVKVGDKIKIVYQGLGEKKAGKNPPKIFSVFKDVEKPEPSPVVQKIA